MPCRFHVTKRATAPPMPSSSTQAAERAVANGAAAEINFAVLFATEHQPESRQQAKLTAALMKWKKNF